MTKTKHERFRDLEIRVGQAVTIDMVPDTQIHVSRRGIIDLLWRHNGSWRLTGLKRGSVLIRATKSNGEEVQRIMVTISSIQKKKFQSSSNFKKLMVLACTSDGIRCNKDNGIINGTTDSWPIYIKTQSLCRKNPPCQFRLHLRKSGIELLKKDLNTYLQKGSSVSATSSGRIIVTAQCNQKNRDQLVNSIEELTGMNRQDIGLTCRQHEKENLKIITKIFYLKKSDINQLGIDAKNILSAYNNPISKLSAFINRNNERILSSPEIDIIPGKNFTITAGGEVLYTGSSNQKDDHWKHFGIKLTGNTEMKDADHFYLHFKLTLKLPSSQNRSTFQGSSLESDAILQINQPKILGEVEANFRMSRKQGVAILEDFPIIGPLFSWKEEKNSETRLYLWMTIQKLTAKGNN